MAIKNAGHSALRSFFQENKKQYNKLKKKNEKSYLYNVTMWDSNNEP